MLIQEEIELLSPAAVAEMHGVATDTILLAIKEGEFRQVYRVVAANSASRSAVITHGIEERFAREWVPKNKREEVYRRMQTKVGGKGASRSSS